MAGKIKSTTVKDELMKDWDSTLREYNIVDKLLATCANEDYYRLSLRHDELKNKLNEIIKKIKKARV